MRKHGRYYRLRDQNYCPDSTNPEDLDDPIMSAGSQEGIIEGLCRIERTVHPGWLRYGFVCIESESASSAWWLNSSRNGRPEVWKTMRRIDLDQKRPWNFRETIID